MNIKCKTKDYMIIKLSNLKWKTKLNFNRTNSKWLNEMNYLRQIGTFQSEEDCFSKNLQSTAMDMQEALPLLNSLYTKLQIQNKIITYRTLCFTIISSQSDGGEN